MTERIIAFLLLILVSAINLWTDFSAVKIVLTQGFDYRFDWYNFSLYAYLFPIWMILYIPAIVLIILALRNNRKHRHVVLLPFYVIILKLLLFVFSPGLKDTLRFNYSLIIGFSTDCLLFLLVSFGIIFHLIKYRNFSFPPLKASRKTGLL
jgi:hypothetical protein